ncbi:hypothetical protein BKA81DRAFT_435062 [Phyllosticta paracitricarpa]
MPTARGLVCAERLPSPANNQGPAAPEDSVDANIQELHQLQKYPLYPAAGYCVKRALPPTKSPKTRSSPLKEFFARATQKSTVPEAFIHADGHRIPPEDSAFANVQEAHELINICLSRLLNQHASLHQEVDQLNQHEEEDQEFVKILGPSNQTMIGRADMFRYQPIPSQELQNCTLDISLTFCCRSV